MEFLYESKTFFFFFFTYSRVSLSSCYKKEKFKTTLISNPDTATPSIFRFYTRHYSSVEIKPENQQQTSSFCLAWIKSGYESRTEVVWLWGRAEDMARWMSGLPGSCQNNECFFSCPLSSLSNLSISASGFTFSFFSPREFSQRRPEEEKQSHQEW